VFNVLELKQLILEPEAKERILYVTIRNIFLSVDVCTSIDIDEELLIFLKYFNDLMTKNSFLVIRKL